jgi:hypothetical protein
MSVNNYLLGPARKALGGNGAVELQDGGDVVHPDVRDRGRQGNSAI